MESTTLSDINVATRNQLEVNLGKVKDEFHANQNIAHRIIRNRAADELARFVIGMIKEYIAVYDFARKASQGALLKATQEMNDEQFVFTLNYNIALLQLALTSYDECHDIYRCLGALNIEGFSLPELNIAISVMHDKRNEVGLILQGLKESLNKKR